MYLYFFKTFYRIIGNWTCNMFSPDSLYKPGCLYLCWYLKPTRAATPDNVEPLFVRKKYVFRHKTVEYLLEIVWFFARPGDCNISIINKTHWISPQCFMGTVCWSHANIFTKKIYIYYCLSNIIFLAQCYLITFKLHQQNTVMVTEIVPLQ